MASVGTTHSSVNSWAQAYLARSRTNAPPQPTLPAPSGATGRDRDWLDGVTFDRPTEIIPTVLTNIVESLTGTRDDRTGRAASQVLLSGYQFAMAGVHHAAKGQGIVATGSSVLGKVLPTIGVASGLMQVWKGWNELKSHEGGPLALLGSRTGRSGILNVIAGAMCFFPGVGTAIGGALTRLVAAANEMDAFSFLDAPTRSIEEQGYDVARRVHVFDETPLDPYDRTRRSDRRSAD